MTQIIDGNINSTFRCIGEASNNIRRRMPILYIHDFNRGSQASAIFEVSYLLRRNIDKHFLLVYQIKKSQKKSVTVVADEFYAAIDDAAFIGNGDMSKKISIFYWRGLSHDPQFERIELICRKGRFCFSIALDKQLEVAGFDLSAVLSQTSGFMLVRLTNPFQILFVIYTLNRLDTRFIRLNLSSRKWIENCYEICLFSFGDTPFRIFGDGDWIEYVILVIMPATFRRVWRCCLRPKVFYDEFLRVFSGLSIVHTIYCNLMPINCASKIVAKKCKPCRWIFHGEIFAARLTYRHLIIHLNTIGASNFHGRLLQNGWFRDCCRPVFLAERPAAKQYHGVIAHPFNNKLLHSIRGVG